MLRIIILLVALGAGGLAAWMSVRYLGQQPQVVEVAVDVPRAEVLVLGQALPRGSVISADDLRWQPLPIEGVPEMAILREERPGAAEELVGRVARADLLKGDALRAENLVDGGAGLMSLVLRPGMRAVGVRITEDNTAGGFILPDDKVDILHTVVRDVDGDGQATGLSRTILTNVRVLAIGQTSARSAAKNVETGATVRPGSDVTAFGDTATVELTPEQAEILTAAQSSGALSLSLRAVSDFGDTAIGADAIIEATGSDRKQAEASGAARGKGPQPGPGSVRVIDGGEIRTVSLQN
ncbi:Flp pilus assembly protein CpaB [Palleronia rufa]|uniref:Flp pilus assembly protein CpaB n=1 Tax=Palleronia rufa TaxID=1530186 RepID=UPI00068F3677|nr:Flp pilus assembly protein CpaB [Palleronia rufa]